MEESKLTLISVKEASKMIGIPTEVMQSGLKAHVFPFGFALFNPDNKYRCYRYYIFEELLQKFIDGKLTCVISKCDARCTKINYNERGYNNETIDGIHC